VEFLSLAAPEWFSLDWVSTSSTKICVSFIFRCALIFVDTYAHTLFLEVNFNFQFHFSRCFLTGISQFICASRRFCIVCKSENSIPCKPSGRPCHIVRTLICLNCQPFGWRVIPSRRPSPKHHPSGRRELSVQTFPYVEKFWTTPACIRLDVSAARPNNSQCSTSFRISFQNTVIGRSLQNPDDVDSCPDALIHKASIAFKIQTFWRQSAWSGRVCIRYGNCVHQINRPDDHSPGSDARSLYMGITCSGSATVRTTSHHRPDADRKQERISSKFSGSWSHSEIRMCSEISRKM
jgi:hypothetical protein